MKYTSTAEERLSQDEKPVSRRSLIKGGAVGLVVAATALAGPNKARAQGDDKLQLILEVENAVFTSGPGGSSDFGTDPPSPPAEAVNNFVVVGDIVSVNGREATGKYFCKGVAFFNSELRDGTPDQEVDTFVDQQFRIDGQGSIVGIGAEGVSAGSPIEGGTDELVIVGGSGRFDGVTGSYSNIGGAPMPFEDGNLTFEFKIE